MPHDKLASTLNTLPVEIGKINLWLVYKELKPMASIVLTFDWDTDKSKQVSLINWFDKANIYFKISQKFSNTIHISKEEKLLEINSEYELSDSSKAHLERGLLYGFPKEAVKEYSKEIVKEKPFPNTVLVFPSMVDELRNKYWYPYTEYVLRRGFEIEDSLVAKRWADVAREEIPGVASEFEKDTIKGMEELRIKLLKELI